MIILDTNVVSEMLRPAPAPAVSRWLAAQAGETIYLTSVTEAELRYGLAILPEGQRRSRLAQAVDLILREDLQGRILPFDSEAAAEYARIAAARKVAGYPISQFDCQIAAIARVHSATLTTRNARDFRDTGVEIVDPWQQPDPADGM